jgi:hypothetical protein
MLRVPELPRMKRRPRPLRDLDQTARVARRKLEVDLFRERLVRHNIRFAPDELQRIDDERRVAAYGAVPSRSAMIRQLINDGLLLRKSMRPKSPPRRPKGQPYIGLDD